MNGHSTSIIRTIQAIGCCAVIFSFSYPARADIIDDAKIAEKLFKEARAAIAKDNYAIACPKFEESLKLVRRAGTLFNLAQCEEHEGRLVAAMQYYKEGIVVLDPGDARLRPSKRELAKIEPRIPYLTVKVSAELPNGSRVALDGRDIEALDKEFPVDPGKHTIAVFAPKRQEESFTIELAEKEHMEISVKAGELIPEPPPRPPSPVVDVLGSRRIAGIALLGVGGLGFVAAGITGGLIISANGRVEEGCPNVRCNSSAGYEAAELGKTLIVMNTVSWGMGIAGASAGAILLLLGSKKSAEKPKTGYSLVVGPGFLGAQGSF